MYQAQSNQEVTVTSRGGLPILYLVAPCYNEQEILPSTVAQITAKLGHLISTGQIASTSRVCFVDDGSKDTTWSLIEYYCQQSQLVKGIKLSRNCGHQNALLAGLMVCKDYSDIVISIDVDLQDDINVIDQMIYQYQQGCEIVYGVRNNRQTDSVTKRSTAQLFYKLLKILGVNIVYNHADYRLMSKQALEILAKYSEVNLFLRAIVPQIGLRTGIVEYHRLERTAGVSKYPLSKMLKLALDGISSFSIRPIRLILLCGVLVSLVGVVLVGYSIYIRLTSLPTSGWAFLSASIWILGGIQMLSIGIIGEYIGKTYSETKRRPRYVIEYMI